MFEIVDQDASGTYRGVYTIKYKEMVFVLHAFQKKSKQGIKTPKSEIDSTSRKPRALARGCKRIEPCEACRA